MANIPVPEPGSDLAEQPPVNFDVNEWRVADDGTIFRRGVTKYANGDVYDGEWLNGKRHGIGTHTYKNGDSYSGEFIDGFWDGKYL